jgi:hypothetical protein
MGPVLPFVGPALGIAGAIKGSRDAGPAQQTTNTQVDVPGRILPQFNTAQGAINNQFLNAGGGSGFENFNQPLGRNLIGRTLAGQFLDPFNNPGLQGTLNRGADFIQNRLNTDFGAAGRNLGAARPAAADALGTFTSDLLFRNFNAERGRQQGALGDVAGFDPTNQFLGRLGGLSNIAQGNQSLTEISPGGDRLAGALGGLQAGAGLGGNLGTLLGGIFPSNSGGGGFSPQVSPSGSK